MPRHMLICRKWCVRAVYSSFGILCELNDCICCVFQRGWTALHLAAQEGNIDVAKLLIDAKAQVNIQEEVCALTQHIIIMN